VSFFSDERASELRELFFESATELLQALNDDGMQLEKRPGDSEIVRQVRRTVHTLKGDSAACGFQELSSLAHILEDALTPELAQQHGGAVAELVLNAADTFQQMLSAYRSNSSEVPDGAALRYQIDELVQSKSLTSVAVPAVQVAPVFAWSEYHGVVIGDALKRGLKVWEVAADVDANCLVPAAALQMVKSALEEMGTLLVITPDDAAPTQKFTRVEAAVATGYDAAHIQQKCTIPAVTANVIVRRAEAAAAAEEPETDLLGILDQTESKQAEAAAQKDSGAALQETLRVDAEKIDSVLNLVGELVIGKSMLTQTVADFDKRYAKDPLRAKFADALAFQARVLNDLQKQVMKIRMVPVEHLFRRFPRLVRDVSKTCDKTVELVVSGQDTDLDKGILDMLAEPLAHLVRNAIAHGIETEEARVAAGKSPAGAVRLNAYHQGNHVVIEVADDGGGIQKDRVLAKAIQQNLVTREEAERLTDSEVYELIFAPGFSTADEVTSVSGRGVGMDVVKTVIERLKGGVTIESKPGQGTRFLLKVPLTLAIIKALMFRVSGRLYAIPLTSVVEITRAQESEVHTVDRREVIRMREEVLPLVRLSGMLEGARAEQKKLFIVVIAQGDRKYGLVVDRLVGEEELVIKALDDHLVATELVSGASILGDGTVVLILNLHALVSRAGKVSVLGASA
jgi:two-component system, chemotaxis family, sensor kinase CheA